MNRVWVNHSICIQCWVKREGSRAPVRVRDTAPEPCCFCEGVHASGIYVRGRWDEAGAKCQGDCA
jgi:hypothetical protein